MSLTSVLLASILVVDIVLGVLGLFGLQNVRSAGIPWVTWRYQLGAVLRSLFPLVVLLALWMSSLYRGLALVLYAIFKCLLSIVVVLLVMVKAADLPAILGTLAQHGNWWYPVSTAVFAAAVLAFFQGRRLMSVRL